ncbi:MAG: hypothetical protein M1816_000629 [Peltula sp. TS41687]|nr:MAG: hypothetical protein M1816_000629 [Peltula sp. TS41687]
MTISTKRRFNHEDVVEEEEGEEAVRSTLKRRKPCILPIRIVPPYSHAPAPAPADSPNIARPTPSVLTPAQSDEDEDRHHMSWHRMDEQQRGHNPFSEASRPNESTEQDTDLEMLDSPPMHSPLTYGGVGLVSPHMPSLNRIPTPRYGSFFLRPPSQQGGSDVAMGEVEDAIMRSMGRNPGVMENRMLPSPISEGDGWRGGHVLSPIIQRGDDEMMGYSVMETERQEDGTMEVEVPEELSDPNQAAHLRTKKPSLRIPFSSSAIRTESEPFTQRLRKKIWGTDTPPGQDDPYVRLTPEEKARQEERRRQEPEKKVAAQPEVSDDEYQPATTWDGLETVGDDVEEDQTASFNFKPFMVTTPLTKPEELTAALHRAVVEVYALQQAGRPLSILSRAPVTKEDCTSDVQVVPSADPIGVTLTYPGDTVRDLIFSSLKQDHLDADPEDDSQLQGASSSEFQVDDDPDPEDASMQDPTVEEPERAGSTTQLQELISSWDPSWLSIPLNDLGVKFILLKRVMQLTGHRIPDPIIARIHDIQALQNHLIKPPKPKKLASALRQDEQLSSLPNVSLIDRRVTPIDKERMVGRWKVIERELEKKGLPVTGHERNGKPFMIGT